MQFPSEPDFGNIELRKEKFENHYYIQLYTHLVPKISEQIQQFIIILFSYICIKTKSAQLLTI